MTRSTVTLAGDGGRGLFSRSVQENERLIPFGPAAADDDVIEIRYPRADGGSNVLRINARTGSVTYLRETEESLSDDCAMAVTA